MRLKSLRSNWILFFLCPYLAGLAAFGRRFAYLRINIAGFPLFISEITLGLALLYLLTQKDIKNKISTLPKNISIPFLLFLLWGTLRLVLSYLDGQYSAFQLVKDFAICFLSVWFFAFYFLNNIQLKACLISTFVGAALGNLYEWYTFASIGTFAEHFVNEIGGPAGNLAITALFPFIFTLVPRNIAWALSLTYGHSLFGQLFFYFKKSWMLVFLLVGLPMATLFNKNGDKVPRDLEIAKRLSFILSAFIAGTLLSALTAFLVSKRDPIYPTKHDGTSMVYNLPFFERDRVKGDSRFGNLIGKAAKEIADNPTNYFFHGEEDQGGKLAWRLHMWKQAWNGILESPIIGKGFGPLTVKTHPWGKPAVDEVTKTPISGPHNSFLTVIFRVGFFGFILFLLPIVFILQNFIRSNKNKPYLWLTFFGFIALVLNTAFNVILENPQGAVWFWMFLAFLGKKSIDSEEFSTI